MKLTKKTPKTNLSVKELTDAFAAQRQADGNSVALRKAVQNLLGHGKASTVVVGKVFALIVTEMAGQPGRITGADIENVLTGYSVQ